MINNFECRVLNSKEEFELGRIIKNGGEKAIEARNQLVTHNLKLVSYIAKRYLRDNLQLEDLFTYGVDGLMAAAEKFDCDLGYRFSTYAVDWIKQAIVRGIRSEESNIRYPMYIKDLSKVSHTMLSLDKEMDSDTSFINIIADENVVDPVELLANEERNEAIKEVFNLLNPRECKIVQLRMGCSNDGKVLSYEQIGNLPDINLSRERVRQIWTGAIIKMRNNKKIIELLSDYVA